MSRYKRVIGDTLKSRSDARRVTEVAIAVKLSNQNPGRRHPTTSRLRDHALRWHA